MIELEAVRKELVLDIEFVLKVEDSMQVVEVSAKEEVVVERQEFVPYLEVGRRWWLKSSWWRRRSLG